MSNRNRKNFRNEVRLLPIIYFDPNPINAVSFREIKSIDINNVIKNYYYADTFGNVFNIKNQVLSPVLTNSGYYTYSLITENKNPKYKTILAHRLIMQTFNPIDNIDEMTVNHINMYSGDNSLENLEWVSQKENNDKKYDTIPIDGTNNYQSLFSYAQLCTIIDGIDNKRKYKDILIDIGMEPSDNNYDYIGNIKRGKTYKKEVEEIRHNKFND